MRRFGIKGKMLCVIVPIILGIMISFFVLSRGQIEKLARRNLESESQMYEENISGWTDRILSELKVYSDAIDSGLFQDDAQILQYLETSMDKNEAYPNGIYMGDDTGVYLDGSGWVPDDDWVLVERDWYIEGKEHETLAFGAPYYDSLSKQMCVSASVRIQNTKAVRVMAADVYLDYVCGLMKEIESGVNGTAFLVEKDSQKILAHSDAEYMDKSLSDSGLDSLYQHIGTAFADGSEKAANMQGDHGTYFVCMNDIAGTDWCLVTAISEREVLRELHWLEAVMLAIAVLAVLLLTVALIRVTNGVVRPVKQVTDVLSQVAEGDFAQDIDVKGSDELARMGSSMQQFIQNMREIITELTSTSEWMNSQSKENGVASANLLASADEQEQEMGELSQTAEMLAQTAGQVSDAMTRLADIIHQTKQAGTQAGDIMKETADASHQGQMALGNIRGNMQEIESTTYSLAGQIKETSDAIDRINNMVTMIMEIAEQTNLLSLNASIEAARAGEAGRGFAVVAEEIGKLAVDSGKAASDIAELTQDIRETMAKANQHMEASVTEVKNSAGMVENATTTFSHIFDKVGQTDTIVHHMVDMIDQVDTVASETVGLADGQLAAAQGITASVDRINSCAQSVAENSSHVAENAQALEQQADALASRMNQFTV